MIQLKRFRVSFYGVALIVAAVATFSKSSNADSLPHTFSAGTPAKAEEVNQNFSHLEQRIQNLEGSGNDIIKEGLKKTLTGTVSIYGGYEGNSRVVYGTGTLFLTELAVDGIIIIEGRAFHIASIHSDTQLTLTDWFARSVSNVTAYTVDDLLTAELNGDVNPIVNNRGYLLRRVQRATGKDQSWGIEGDRYVENRKLDFYKSKSGSAIRITYTDWVRALSSTPCVFEIKVDRESCSIPKPVRYFNADYNQGFSEVLYCKTSKRGLLAVEVYVNSGCADFGHDDSVGGQRIDTLWVLEAEEVY